jgi:hypothetical protein
MQNFHDVDYRILPHADPLEQFLGLSLEFDGVLACSEVFDIPIVDRSVGKLDSHLISIP